VAVEETHALASTPPGPARLPAAGRPFLRSCGLHAKPTLALPGSTCPPAFGAAGPSAPPTAADDFAGTPSPAAFRLFTPYQVGAAIAAFAGALLSPGRQLELTTTFTMGAIEGNIVGVVAMEEDIQQVTAALMTFYRRNHRGDHPYATKCRVLRFLRRMQ